MYPGLLLSVGIKPMWGLLQSKFSRIHWWNIFANYLGRSPRARSREDVYQQAATFAWWEQFGWRSHNYWLSDMRCPSEWQTSVRTSIWTSSLFKQSIHYTDKLRSGRSNTEQNTIPLYCQRSSDRLHMIGTIYRPFLVQLILEFLTGYRYSAVNLDSWRSFSFSSYTCGMTRNTFPFLWPTKQLNFCLVTSLLRKFFRPINFTGLVRAVLDSRRIVLVPEKRSITKVKREAVIIQISTWSGWFYYVVCFNMVKTALSNLK